MYTTGHGGFIDCSWHEIEKYSQPLESDFLRVGKLGGGENQYRILFSKVKYILFFFRYIW